MKKILILIIILLVALNFRCDAKESKLTKIIAVMPFQNSTGMSEYEHLQKGITDILAVQLAEIEGISVVERENLDKILNEYKLALSGKLDQKDSVMIGKVLGAHMVLTGGFIFVGDELKVNGHLYNVETTQLIKSEEISGKVNEIIALTHKLIRKLMRDLDLKIKELNPSGELDKSPEENLHFTKGLGYFYGCMYDHAVMEFINTLNLNLARGDARFWNAKSYYAQKEWAHAKIELERFLAEFPNSEKAKEALKMLTSCESNLQDWEKDLFNVFKCSLETK